MSVSLVFLVGLMALFLGWLLVVSIRSRPWVAQPAGVAPPRTLPEGFTAPRIALAVFLAVVTSIFALAISAYVMRMALSPDWRFLPTPRLAWVNTGFLVLGSLALEAARRGARRGRTGELGLRLGLGAVGALAFLAGQFLLWRQLANAGYYLASEPGSAFYVLMSGLHAGHLLGGLAALAWIGRGLRRGMAPSRVREAVGLAAFYWHYLLLVWIVLFVVLFVGAEPLYALCRS